MIIFIIFIILPDVEVYNTTFGYFGVSVVKMNRIKEITRCRTIAANFGFGLACCD